MSKKISICCGAYMPDYLESDICPDCGEHTEVEDEQEEPGETLDKIKQ